MLLQKMRACCAVYVRLLYRVLGLLEMLQPHAETTQQQAYLKDSSPLFKTIYFASLVSLSWITLLRCSSG